MDPVLARFVGRCPAAVLVRLLVEQALAPDWLDAVFDRHAKRQYTQEVLFSTMVDLMNAVVVGVYPALNAALKHRAPPDVRHRQTLYQKVARLEPGVQRALVRACVARLDPLLIEDAHRPALLPGYAVRIADGNHLPASEKRLAPLRGRRGAALPGQALVVYDPDRDLVCDLVVAADAYAAEQALLGELTTDVGPNECWILDAGFATRDVLWRFVDRAATCVIRESSATGQPTARGPLRACGRVATGRVFEQAVALPHPKDARRTTPLRRIELHLDAPTSDGVTVIRLLTNLPATVAATRIAELYRTRWSIEGVFARLEADLHSEVRELGYPAAALFAFTLALVDYNVLTMVRRYIAAAHDDGTAPVRLSLFDLVVEARAWHEGLSFAVAPAVWDDYATMRPAALRRVLRAIAAKTDLRRYQNPERAPKVRTKKDYVSRAKARAHVATARLLPKPDS